MLNMPSMLSVIVFMHGLAAASFVIVFLLQAASISVPLYFFDLPELIGPSELYTTVSCLWIACGIGTFASYE